MVERKLATIEEILDIQPIENADALELATVRGWEVVVRKGEFSIGQRVVYFEIDSFLDVGMPQFSFLESRGTRAINNPGDEKKKLYGHALRTIKLRGQISQGLILPLSEFPFLVEDPDMSNDVTELLGVLKYEPYIKPQNGPRRISTFPTQYATKSDAERVQNLGKVWDRLQAIRGWYATQKLDGQSVTYFKDDEGTLRMASRNFEVSDEDSKLYHWMDENREALSILNSGDAVQGELYGEGIQNNPQKLKGIKFAPFNYFVKGSRVSIYDWYLTSLGDMHVPFLDHLEFPETIKEAVDQAFDLRQVDNKDLQAEGIVWHNDSPEVAKLIGRNCFKSINSKFLLKNEN